jgi:hypothetical protein
MVGWARTRDGPESKSVPSRFTLKQEINKLFLEGIPLSLAV